MRRNNLGMPGHPTVVVAHPIASMKPDQVAELASDALHEVAGGSDGQRRLAGVIPDINSRRFEAPDSLDAINDLFEERGWTDGLPIVPPTEERVRAMLEAGRDAPSEVLARMPPINGSATVEKVAINAVMAGCKPEHFPVVLAAVKAVCHTEYNLGGIQSTTGGAAPLIVVQRPHRETIERELRRRSVRQRVPGQRHHRARPALGDAQYRWGDSGADRQVDPRPRQPSTTFCIAENEEPQPVGTAAHGARSRPAGQHCHPVRHHCPAPDQRDVGDLRHGSTEHPLRFPLPRRLLQPLHHRGATRPS